MMNMEVLQHINWNFLLFALLAVLPIIIVGAAVNIGIGRWFGSMFGTIHTSLKSGKKTEHKENIEAAEEQTTENQQDSYWFTLAAVGLFPIAAEGWVLVILSIALMVLVEKVSEFNLGIFIYPILVLVWLYTLFKKTTFTGSITLWGNSRSAQVQNSRDQ